jgi:hypothetical protein
MPSCLHLSPYEGKQADATVCHGATCSPYTSRTISAPGHLYPSIKAWTDAQVTPKW